MNALQLVDQVVIVGAERGLALVTQESPAGVVHVDREPDELIRELLRLARIGAVVELAADFHHPRSTPRELIERAKLVAPFGEARV